MGGSPAWRLNSAPMGRQTTPPERAGELPARKAKKQHNFLTGLRKKNAAEPCAAEAGCSCSGSQVSQASETERHMRRAEL